MADGIAPDSAFKWAAPLGRLYRRCWYHCGSGILACDQPADRGKVVASADHSASITLHLALLSSLYGAKGAPKSKNRRTHLSYYKEIFDYGIT
jgi:hypothetical protein